jgi:hypothetical protein
MKTFRYAIIMAVAASAAACVDKTLDPRDISDKNKFKIGAIAVGDADLYIGKSDTFRLKKFIPDNAYLRVENGVYSIHLQDTISTALPKVDSVSFNMKEDLYTNLFKVDNLVLDDLTNINIPPPSFQMQWQNNSSLYASANATMSFPINVSGNNATQIAQVDTIFFLNAADTGKMTITVNTAQAHQTHNINNGGANNDSIIVSMTFPDNFKLRDDNITRITTANNQITYSKIVAGSQNCTGQSTADCTYMGKDSAEFTFYIEHYRANTTLASLSNKTENVGVKIEYKIQYGNGNNSNCSNNACTPAIPMKMSAAITPHDVAITTADNIPVPIQAMIYQMKNSIDIPAEVKSIDSVMLQNGHNTIQVLMQPKNFPFNLSSHTGSGGGIDSGKVHIEFPSIIKFNNASIDQTTNRPYQEYNGEAIMTSPTLAIKYFDTHSRFVNSQSSTEMVIDDSVVTKPTVLFIQKTSIRKSRIESMKTDTPKIVLGVKVNITAEKIKGTFAVEQIQNNLKQSFDIGEFRRELSNIDSVALGIEDAKINLTVSNPTGMHFTEQGSDDNRMSLKIEGWKNGQKIKEAQPIYIKVDPAVSPDNPKITPNPIAGEEIKPIMDDLLNFDSIVFSADVSKYAQGLPNQTIFMQQGKEAKPLEISYKFEIPNLVKGFYIRYIDTISIGSIKTEGSSEGEGQLKGVRGTLSLTLECQNTLPLGLLLKVEPFDKDNKKIPDLEVKLKDANGKENASIEAAKTSEVTLEVSAVSENSNALDKLAALRVEAELAGKGEGTLRDSDFVLISVKLKTSGITVDADKFTE